MINSQPTADTYNTDAAAATCITMAPVVILQINEYIYSGKNDLGSFSPYLETLIHATSLPKSERSQHLYQSLPMLLCVPDDASLCFYLSTYFVVICKCCYIYLPGVMFMWVNYRVSVCGGLVPASSILFLKVHIKHCFLTVESMILTSLNYIGGG